MSDSEPSVDMREPWLDILEYDIAAGDEIGVVAAKMSEMARESGKPVVSRHNAVPLIVLPGDSKEQTEERWRIFIGLQREDHPAVNPDRSQP